MSFDTHKKEEPLKPGDAADEARSTAKHSAEAKIAELEALLKGLQEQALRQRADFENSRKRLERDKAEAIKYANEKLLTEILQVVDNFDRAMTSLAEGHDPAKVQQGLRIAQGELHKVLETHGVQVIQAAGQSFDPALHEAVAVVEDKKFKDGTVVDEIQRGYLLNGRLIRPSRVRIAKNEDHP